MRAVVGSTYLVRVVSPSEHDHLVAFACLEEDDYGQTLAWRILQRWDLGGARGTRKTEIFMPGMPDPEPWMLEASIDELLGVLARIKSVGEERLLAVPADLGARHGGLQLARILDGDSYECVIQKRGGGRYFSFETLDNDYDSEPDLELYRRTFTSGFAGHDRGFLLDLGEVPLEQVGDSRLAAPPTLAEEELAAWDFLWDVRVPPAPRGDRLGQALSDDDLARARELGIDRGVAAELEHTYLLRSIVVGGHDLLVAFTPVASDEYGLFLAWRLLRRR